MSINNPELENYLDQMYPVEFKIKLKDTTESTTSASYLDLLLSIGRDGHFHTSIYYNVTISISMSQIFLSWVAIYQLHPPMASLSHSLYDMPRLAPRMNVLFLGRPVFQITFEQGYVRKRMKWSLKNFLGDTGILSSLKNAEWHSVAWPNTMTTLLYQSMTFLSNSTF